MPLPADGLFPPTPPGADTVVTKRLRPGAPGTQRWLEIYGESLVCVRYREDKARRRRYTTVEIVVAERCIPIPAMAFVRISFTEIHLRQQAKALGGKWDATRRLWRLPRQAIEALHLENRIIEPCHRRKVPHV